MGIPSCQHGEKKTPPIQLLLSTGHSSRPVAQNLLLISPATTVSPCCPSRSVLRENVRAAFPSGFFSALARPRWPGAAFVVIRNGGRGRGHRGRRRTYVGVALPLPRHHHLPPPLASSFPQYYYSSASPWRSFAGPQLARVAAPVSHGHGPTTPAAPNRGVVDKFFSKNLTVSIVQL